MQRPTVPDIERGRLVKESPAVSIVVPCYNTAHYVAEALDSVLAQTFENYECLVVNDGSPDTAELERALAPYRDHIVYIRQENRGLSGARNTAIRSSRAPLIALLDSDDVWEPDYLAVQLSLMERDPALDVLYPDALIFGDDPRAGRTFMEVCPSEGEVTVESLLTQRCNVFIGVTARREALVRAGLFDEELGNLISEDFDMWLRVLNCGGRIAYHRRALVRYRRHATNITADGVAVWRRALRAMEKARRTLTLSASDAATLERETARFHALLRYYEGWNAFSRGDLAAAMEGLGEAHAYFKSRRMKLALLLMRRSPRLLRGLYNLEGRLMPGSARP